MNYPYKQTWKEIVLLCFLKKKKNIDKKNRLKEASKLIILQAQFK